MRVSTRKLFVVACLFGGVDLELMLDLGNWFFEFAQFDDGFVEFIDLDLKPAFQPPEVYPTSLYPFRQHI